MEQAGEAIEALARVCRLPFRPTETPAPGDGHMKKDAFAEQTRWLASTAAAMGLEVEAVQAAHREVDRLIEGAAPALLRIEHDGRSMLLALRSGTRRAAS